MVHLLHCKCPVWLEALASGESERDRWQCAVEHVFMYMLQKFVLKSHTCSFEVPLQAERAGTVIDGVCLT